PTPTSAAMAAETGSGASGGVRAAVVLREDLDVLMAVTAFELVLDPEIGEVHAIVEVREVVLTGPPFDLASVPIRAPVTVRPTAVVLLEEALVLPLEVVLEDDPPNLRTLFAETRFRAEVGVIEGRVVRQLTGPADAR